MKLHYLHTVDGTLRVLVLYRAGHRIELYIKSVDDGIWALVALAGDTDSQPARNKCQGPYHSADQAEAAVRGIGASLLSQGYRVENASNPRWPLPAQRLAREIRDGRQAHAGNYEFDPEQHEPLW